MYTNETRMKLLKQTEVKFGMEISAFIYFSLNFFLKKLCFFGSKFISNSFIIVCHLQSIRQPEQNEFRFSEKDQENLVSKNLPSYDELKCRRNIRYCFVHLIHHIIPLGRFEEILKSNQINLNYRNSCIKKISAHFFT